MCSQFAKAMPELGLGQFQFRPHSLRRGGATFWFAKHGSFDRLSVQGRWRAAKTARIYINYINSGLAASAEMKIPVTQLRGLQLVYKTRWKPRTRKFTRFTEMDRP